MLRFAEHTDHITAASITSGRPVAKITRYRPANTYDSRMNDPGQTDQSEDDPDDDGEATMPPPNSYEGEDEAEALEDDIDFKAFIPGE